LHTPQLFGSLRVSPQEDCELPPLPFDELHPESATMIAELHAIVAKSANRTKLWDLDITTVLAEQGRCPGRHCGVRATRAGNRRGS
jgi:hypothetical protein